MKIVITMTSPERLGHQEPTLIRLKRKETNPYNLLSIFELRRLNFFGALLEPSNRFELRRNGVRLCFSTNIHPYSAELKRATLSLQSPTNFTIVMLSTFYLSARSARHQHKLGLYVITHHIWNLQETGVRMRIGTNIPRAHP